MRVTRSKGVPTGLIAHTGAGLQFPLFRINDRQVMKFLSCSWLDYVGEDSADSWRRLKTTTLIDAQLRHWSVESLDLGRRSWRPQHWLTPTPILHATWGLRPLPSLSFQEARAAIVEMIAKHRWYGQGGETRVQFLERMETYGDLAALAADFSMYGNWVGPRRKPGFISD